MRSVTWICLAVFLCAGGVTSGVAKEDEEKVKTPEEEVAGSKDRTTVAGKFRLDRALLQDGKPLPKVIGTITPPKGAAYQVIVDEKSFMELLVSCDGKEMTLCGKMAIVQDKGAFLLADSQITPPTPPVTRRKRGGL